MSDLEEKPAEEEFLEARIDNISLTNAGFIVFLKCGDDARTLPIFIGPNEAQSIALALSHEPPPRPMTHDLLKNMLEFLDGVVTRVEITDIKDNTFFGKVHVSKAGVEDFEFDARPSDAIALAIRWEAPVSVSRRVFEAAAVTVAEKEEAPPLAETAAPSRLEILKQALEKAVREEHYEEAARLRDQLRKMRSGN